MKYFNVGLSLLLASAIGASGADSLEEAFANAKTSGQIRAFYITRDRSGTIGDTQTDRSAFALGGHLKIETAPIEGVSFGAAFYTTQDIGVNSDTEDKVNPSLFGEGKESYHILGEAYMKYVGGTTTLTIGRQKLNTPLASADDARMLPNLFEAAVLTNSDLIDTTLVLGHVTKMAAGTFSNQYGSNTLSLHSGYGLNNISGKFKNMGTYAVGEDTAGVTVAAMIYNGVQNTTIQLWDYYAHDILNAIYAQADIKWKCIYSDTLKPFASFQLISESDIGDKFAGDVDSTYYGFKIGGKYNSFSLYGAYSQTDSSVGSATNGGIITPWGGMPAFTQGMVTRHMFFADTSAWKVATSYNTSIATGKVKSALYYVNYDVGADNGVKNGVDWTENEFGFDLQYYPLSVKNLQLRLRGNFPTDFVEGLDWSEYRFIVNYNF